MTINKRFKIRMRSGLVTAVLVTAAVILAASVPAPPAVAAFDLPQMHLKGGSGLTFQIDVVGNPSVADLAVVGPITFEPGAGPPLLTVELAEDVLCMQNGVQPGVTVELTDTNGRMTAFDGFAGISYFPTAMAPVAGMTLKVQTDNNPKCALVPPIAKAAVMSGTPVECALSDILFGDGFETGGGGSASGPNLQVDFRLIQYPNTSTGDPAKYQIHVTNCGDATATTVAVRDIFPTDIAPLPRFQAGGLWQCVTGAACNGAAYISHVFSQIPAGATRVIEAERFLDPATAPGGMIRVSAAAVSLSNTPDAQPTFNSGTWQFEVRDNEVPTVSVTDTADSLVEDDGTVAVTGVTIAAADPDPAGFITSVAVTSDTPSILTIDSVDDTDPNNVLVSVTTVPDAFGPATLRVVATDDLDGTSIPVTFDVAVDPVNDPPSITVLGGFSGFDGIGSPSFSGPCTETSAAGCANQGYASSISGYSASFSDWVVSVSKGPANEPETEPTPVISAPVGDAIFFGGASGEPALEFNAGTTTWDLEYVLSGASGTATVTITVDDGQTANNVSTVTFEISVDNAAPSVTASQSFSVDENATGSVGTITGDDPEMDPLQDWTITGGNTDVDLDTNPPFALNPATGELSVNDADDLDFEDTASFTLAVTVSDGFATSAPENVTVDLNDLNDNAPVVTSGLTFQVPENSSTCLGNPNCVVTATDADTVGSLQGWAIVSGNVNVDMDASPAFAINASSGTVTINDVGDMDFEQQPSFALMVTVGDGVNTSAQELVTINLINVNDNAPTVDQGQTFNVDENSPEMTAVGTVTGSDADNDPLADWTITGGNDDVDMDTNPAFAIDAATGEITVNDAGDLDYESGTTQFTLTVTVNDGVFTSAVESVTIDINDLAD